MYEQDNKYKCCILIIADVQWKLRALAQEPMWSPWDILSKYVPTLHICHDIIRQEMTRLQWENEFCHVQTIINFLASEASCCISHCIQSHT